MGVERPLAGHVPVQDILASYLGQLCANSASNVDGQLSGADPLVLELQLRGFFAWRREGDVLGAGNMEGSWALHEVCCAGTAVQHLHCCCAAQGVAEKTHVCVCVCERQSGWSLFLKISETISVACLFVVEKEVWEGK